ncbi:uncharacterized protein cubi_00235 [Cryptosporidium ubiquitum]|uniref:Secreted protein n=1 Tax=Cryptosporidium ubiquitum TaxID=857276 RepID=A0A1J4MK86_9CRYT|nr:uncharacterized protein cubi_00235 [Cryptosporidium ubiquitum]OII74682.1 hypothetical protein cubi_00235 [Cryptosporidium ubiquitum]
MRYYLFFGILFFIKQVYFLNCSGTSETSETQEDDQAHLVIIEGLAELLRHRQDTGSYVESEQESSTDVNQSNSDIDYSNLQFDVVLVGNDGQQSYATLDNNIVNLAPVASQVQVPTPMPMQRINQGIQFGHSGRLQWIGGPVNFDNMVDCKFYRQNPGFCVPMSLYTPCSRCKARVRTIFRTSYKVRCPGQDSFPAQLRPYFAWVPTSHRNPKREKGIFSRWRRQFMCVVMALSDIPSDVTRFWQHSQISFDSADETPQYVPLLLGPYGDQSTSFGYTAGSNFFASAGGGSRNANYYTRNQNLDGVNS